jgi:hypothetical protein
LVIAHKHGDCQSVCLKLFKQIKQDAGGEPAILNIAKTKPGDSTLAWNMKSTIPWRAG